MKPQRAQWWDPRTWMAFAYWELKTIFAAISDDGWSDWKATTILLALELLAMAALTDAVSVIRGHKLIYRSSPFIYIVPAILILLNLKAILGKNESWNRLSTSFENYPAGSVLNLVC